MLLTKKEVAKKINISVTCLDKWVKLGKFPAPFKINQDDKSSKCLWDSDIIDAFIAKQVFKSIWVKYY